MTKNLEEKLESLKPTSKHRVMDLVKNAGIDVSDWANYKGGMEKASANPKYCYDWSFVNSEKEIIVLNLWFENMKILDNSIVQNLNLREVAKRTTKKRANKAYREDKALKLAIENNYIIRVIVLDGKNTIGEGQKADHRELDPALWYITKYDNLTGDCIVKRSQYIDQFEQQIYIEPKEVEKKETVTQVYKRNRAVREAVKERANGFCEWCGKQGFITEAGLIYLETHHIVQLSEKGADSVENVIALCPNHHRESHFGRNLESIREKLLEIVSKTMMKPDILA